VPEAEHPFAKMPNKVLMAAEETETEQTLLHKPEQAYTTTVSIYNKKVTQKVFEQILEAKVTVTQQELLSLAPEIQTQVADMTVCRHITRTNMQCMLEEFVKPKAAHSSEAHMPVAFSNAMREPLADATIILDPYEAFL
jgi:hypothetical protein